MKWKILACDLDGTLIGWDHKIHDRDLESLRRARTAGLHVSICTGRNSRECAGIIAALGLDSLGVFVNGAMVCNMADGHAVHATCVSDDLADDAIDFFGAAGHSTLALADDPATRMPIYLRTNQAPPHQATVEWLLYNRVEAREVADMPSEFRGRIVRLGVVVNVPEAPALHAKLQRRFGTRCHTHSIYSPHYDCQIIELFHPAANKWTGLQHLAEALQLPAASIVAIGDDVNDLAMLHGASLSFAMGNAAPAVLAAAKRVTSAQRDFGVSEVIDRLLAGEFD